MMKRGYSNISSFKVLIRVRINYGAYLEVM